MSGSALSASGAPAERAAEQMQRPSGTAACHCPCVQAGSRPCKTSARQQGQGQGVQGQHAASLQQLGAERPGQREQRPAQQKPRAQIIKDHPTPLPMYVERLKAEKVVSEGEIQAIQDNVHSILSHNFDTKADYKAEARDWLSSFWAGFNSPSQLSRIRNTGVPMEFLKEARPCSSDLLQGPGISSLLESAPASCLASAECTKPWRDSGHPCTGPRHWGEVQHRVSLISLLEGMPCSS